MRRREEIQSWLRKLEIGRGAQGRPGPGQGLPSDRINEGVVSFVEGSLTSPEQDKAKKGPLPVSELNVNPIQLRDILQYAFNQFDADSDGKISYEEFRIACGLLGMDMSRSVCRQAFLNLSGGREYIIKDNTLIGQAVFLMSSLQSSFFDRFKGEGFAKAEYTLNSVGLALARSDLSIPARVDLAKQAFWGQADALSDITETLSDIIGILFALLSISNEIGCLPNCQEGVDFTNVVPLVVLLRRAFTDSFKKVQDNSVRDLNQDKAFIYTTVFKPAGFSVLDFQQLYEQGEAEWRRLPAGMQLKLGFVDGKLQLLVRGSMKILSQSIVPGLSETSVVLEPGTFIGAANFMDNPEDGMELGNGQIVSVLRESLVLVWEVPNLQRYFQVNAGIKQQFQVMLAKSIESTMEQVSQQAQRMAFELPILFRDFLLGVKLKFRADRATLWVYDESKAVLWTLFVTDEGKTSYVSVDASTGLAGCCFTSRSLLNIKDCYQDDRFNQKVDKQTGYYTKSTLCVPVIVGNCENPSSSSQKPAGVIQLINKLADTETVEENLADKFTYFTEVDEQKAEQSVWLTALMVQQLSQRYNSK